VIPVFDSFDYFASLFPLLLVLVPVLLVVRATGTRVALITLAGLYLLALIAPRLAFFHLVFWLAIAVLQPIVAATGERRSGLGVLGGALAVCLLPVVLWKVWPIEFVIEFNVITHDAVSWPSTWLEALDFTAPILAPIGLSFGAFRAADLLVRSHLGLVDRLRPGRVLATGLFPPLLVVGPIASYDETEATLTDRVPLERQRLLSGTSQILTGLFKVFVIAYLLDWSVEIFALYADNAPWRLWAGLVAFTWFFYVNFAGYSDMAIGAGTLLGADLRPNFNRPYLQTTPAAFWNSWHISLTRFLRINVYTPLVAGHPRRQYAGTTITMLLIALWHGVSWATVAFGLYHAAFLIGHRVVSLHRPPTPSPVFRVAKSVGIFAWFGASLPLLHLSLADSIDFYRAMLGAAV
jgi:D-alanyl-lipoteichoic acid acyltransferase DltB (MBOAT superfamily)